MKTQRTDPTIAGACGSRRAMWTTFVLVVLLLATFVPFAEPVQAAGAASGQPTASYGCTGVYHRVRSGETIYSIAARYGSTAYRIASCNGLRSYTVYVGQSLLVPVYRRSTGGWIESIDFARNASAPAPELFMAHTAP